MSKYDEKLNIIEKYDPYRNDIRFATSSLNEIYKIITSEYNYIQISLKNTLEYKSSSIEPIEEEIEPIEEEIEPIEEEIDLDILANNLITDSKININDLANSLNGKYIDDSLKHLIIPNNFDINILKLLYKSLKNQNFIESKKIISSIPDLKHMEWVKTLPYNNKKLRDMINEQDIDSYKVISIVNPLEI